MIWPGWAHTCTRHHYRLGAPQCQSRGGIRQHASYLGSLHLVPEGPKPSVVTQLPKPSRTPADFPPSPVTPAQALGFLQGRLPRVGRLRGGRTAVSRMPSGCGTSRSKQSPCSDPACLVGHIPEMAARALPPGLEKTTFL